MSDPLRWAETDRETLRAALPEAVVLLPVGATEQHGPHLATGTDALLAHAVTERAAALADASRRLIVAPPLPFGSSDHHLPFGGTLSLSPETFLAVLLDLARSIAVQGGRRLVVVNGHGGNTGICQAFAQAAAVRHDLSVGYFDYWRFAETAGPGHAGEFETALVLAVRPELVRPPAPRPDPPALPAVDRVDVQTASVWQTIDGYTDHPARATEENGRRWLDGIVAAAAAAFVELAKTL